MYFKDQEREFRNAEENAVIVEAMRRIQEREGRYEATVAEALERARVIAPGPQQDEKAALIAELETMLKEAHNG